MQTSSVIKILMVDDAESDRLTYSRYLQSDSERNYRVIEAETLEEGLELWRSQQPDIVLLDLSLPDGDGLEFLEAINVDVAGKRVPVIMLTGQGNEKIAVNAMKLGAADYLVKGDITANLLTTSIRQVVRETALIQQLQQLQRSQLSHQAELEERNKLLERISEELQCTVEELRVSAEEKIEQHQLLQYEEDRYQNLFDFAPDGYLVTDLSGKILNANQAILKLLSISREFILEKPLVLFVASHNRDLFYTQLNRQASPSETKTILEITLINRQGVTFPAEITVAQNINFANQETQLFWMIRDISDRKVAEEALRASEAKSRVILETIPDLMFRVGADQVYRELVSPYRDIAIFPKDYDLGGLSVADVLPPEAVQTQLHYLQQALQTGELQVYEQQLQIGDRLQYEEVRIIKSGEDEALFMIRDISDRKRAEQALQELNQSLEAKVQERTQEIQLQAQMLEQIHDAVISTALDGTILTWNFGAEKLYEYKSDEAIGQNISMLYLNEDLSLIASKVFNPLMTQETHEVELQQRTKSGKIIDIILRLSVVRDAMGNPIRLIGCSNDISDRKRAEQELHQLNQSLERRVENRTALLRESEVKSRAILATIPDIMIRVGADNVYREQITPHRETSIYSRGFDIIGRSINEMFPAENVQLKIHYLQQAIQTGELQIYEQQLQINNRIQYEEVRIIKCGEDEALLMIRDISDRKRTERELQKMNQFLEAKVRERTQELWEVNQIQRAILYSTDYAIISTDTNGIIQTFNTGAEKMLGYNMEEVVGNATPELFFDAQELSDKITAASKILGKDIGVGIEALRYMASEGLIDEEWINIRKDGSRFPVSVSVTTLKDDSGQIIGALSVRKDISDRKLAEDALRASDQRWKFALESAGDGLWDWDVKNDEVFYSPQWKAQLGYADDEIENRLEVWENRVHPDDLAQCYVNINKCLTNEVLLYESEHRLRCKDGSYKWILSRGKVLEWDANGHALRLMGTHTDLSDRKQAEAQLQKINDELLRATKLKDEFLANMSHELRTPLNSILGFSESLKDEILGSLNEKQLKAIATVESSGEHLLALINDILDLSKISAGMVELDIASVSVKNLCSSSLVFVKQQAFNKKIQIHSHIPTHINNINVDERHIKQVLINLLTNAVKFTPNQGNINLLVAIGSGDTWQGEATIPQQIRKMNSPMILLQVVDTGIGIAAKDLQMLFQPFVQVDSALNRQYEGTGLGLALVKQLVELHGGQVIAESEVGQGSCFTVALPYEMSASNAIASIPSSTTSPSLDIAPDNAPLILLAEDNEANIQTFSSYLTAINYRVIIARNGIEAIAQAKANLPDIILMDIQMPIMDGLEATKLIRLDPNLINIPIIALTALAMEGDREKCLAAGANEYVAKPVKLKQLTNTIQQLLAKNEDHE